MNNPLCLLMGLALVTSACAPEASEPSQEPSTQSQTLENDCENGNPILTVSGPNPITLQCNEPWVVPEVSAVSACGKPLHVYRYNTGDDDQDGIPGSIDPDDFGPGPATSVNGEYMVQFLAWDEYYNITVDLIAVNVVNCPE
jgi:hypothetical protein